MGSEHHYYCRPGEEVAIRSRVSSYGSRCWQRIWNRAQGPRRRRRKYDPYRLGSPRMVEAIPGLGVCPKISTV